MKKLRIIIILIIFILSFIGCALKNNINWNDPVEIQNLINIEYDKFTKVKTCKGPSYYTNKRFDIGSRFFIRAWKWDNSIIIKCQIYIVSSYNSASWYFYDRAYDSDGNKLDITLISRDIGNCYNNFGQSSCSFYESVGINISIEYLIKHKHTGVNLKIIGNGGTEVFNIPPSYIIAFLNRVGI